MTPLKDSGRITWIILDTISRLRLGKHKLSEFLKGSRSHHMDYLQHEMGFGGIFWHDIATIVGFIEQLENMELLRRKQMPEFGSYVEILELTEGGKKVLDENINIELQIIKKEKPLIIGETERQTLGLLKSGKTIEEISKERTLAVSTIYDHLHTLTVKKAISLSEFIPQ